MLLYPQSKREKKYSFVVLSDSMSPTIQSGDLITVEKVHASELSVGDIICFLYAGSISDCTLDVNITAKNSVGGVVGNANYGDFTNITIAGSLTADSDVGLVVGLVYWSEYTSITDLTASGDITSYDDIGASIA